MKAFPGEKIAAIAEAVDQGIALCREGRIWWASERLAELLGSNSESELVGASFSDLLVDLGEGLPQADAGPVRCGSRDEAQHEGGLQVTRVSVRSGELWMASPETGLPVIKSRVDPASMSLDEARREVDRLRSELDAHARDREQFLAVLAHELRTPITVIGGYHRLLLSRDSGPLTPVQGQYLTQAEASCQNLDALVGKLLDVSTRSLAAFDLEVQPAKIESIITQACDSLAPLLEKKSLRVETQIDSSVDSVCCDRVRMEQVFKNVLENAIRFSPPATQISVAVRGCASPGGADFAEVSIRDRGRGLDPDLADCVTPPWVCGEGKDARRGMGLGLWICKRVVEAHGGSIEVANDPRGGCQVKFSVPRGLPAIAVDEEKRSNG